MRNFFPIDIQDRFMKQLILFTFIVPLSYFLHHKKNPSWAREIHSSRQKGVFKQYTSRTDNPLFGSCQKNILLRNHTKVLLQSECSDETQ